MAGFLYGQTEYNLLNNTMHLNDYVDNAKAYGYDYLSITDSNMYGHFKFYNACLNKGIIPLIGLEIEVEIKSFSQSILLYCENNKGYQNLLILSSYVLTQEKTISLDILKKYIEGLLIVLPIKNIIRATSMKISDILSIFFEYELNVNFGIDCQTKDGKSTALQLIKFAKDNNIICYPIHQTLYFEEEDRIVYESLRLIDGVECKIKYGENFCYPTATQLEQEFQEFEDLFDNLAQFVARVNVVLEKKQVALPKYPSPNGIDSKEYLSALCKRGLEKRLTNQKYDSKMYEERLNYELSVIHKMGYDDYFLIVWDFVKFAKQNDIMVGPGRGSAAGSLVSYCLGITSINPLEHDLIFERFLNPERISMPDIDLDFPDDKRDFVIEYVKNFYGKNRVCNISAYGTFLVKSSIRDLGRVLKISSNRLDEVIKLAVATENYDELLSRFIDNKEIYHLLRVAKKLEGLPRYISTHAAGIIISNQPLTTIIPIQTGINDMYQSQLEASDLEKIGLLKIDFLGIRNLTIIHNVCQEIGFNNMTINQIPLNDKNTFSLLQNADTLGVFQLESEGIKNVLLKLKPTCFEDLVAVLALYRPGPMDNIDEFIARRHGKKFSYIHPKLKDILEKTYGIIVYQEQIIKIAQNFAGYSLAAADLLRRAVSKKDEKALIEERDQFVKASIAHGFNKNIAQEIYEYILKFANYGFNRSHSVSYALVSYQMAFLKANYFSLFMSKLFNNVIGSATTLESYVNYAKARGVRTLAPNINISGTTFEVFEEGLYLPLQGIFSIGEVLAKKIVEEREKKLFSSFIDFKMRMPQINVRNLEALVFAGCFDLFGKTKKSMIENANTNSEIFDRFLDDVIESNEEYDEDYLREAEKKYLGFNILYNMYNDVEKLKSKFKTVDFRNFQENQFVQVIAAFTKIKGIKTKNDEYMAVVSVCDGSSEIDGVIFPKIYQQYETLLLTNKLFLLRGRIGRNMKNGNMQIIINEIIPV